MSKLLVVLAAALAVVPVASASPSGPVPSLTPAATHRLWRLEVARARQRPQSLTTADCRPARAIFYAQTDWLRLATKLAQNASPCAEYFISVPPLTADKTQPRANQAAQLRALGPNFHALDEISFAGWSTWVAAGNGTWYDAGVLARQRLAAAGFATGTGDTWAVNELSSAVRKGTGAARRNALDFLHGLASGGVRGVVFAAGIGQPTADLTAYKVNLQDWLQDAPFWTEAAGYVTDWAQESYGDLRAYAVAGSSPAERRDALVAYLGHVEALANAGPGTAAAARSLLQQAYVPFGNAAWAWSSAYGWTAGPVESMEDFVSGQVYADRSFGASTGASADRLGFAWAPSNSQGLAAADFNARTDAILGRLAAAIHDTDAPAADPGAAACAPAWCTTGLDGAAFATGWQAFASWSPTVPVFATAPTSAAPGAAAGPITVQLETAGLVDPAVTPRTVTLSSDSAGGGFSVAAAGPWTPTLTLPLPAGSAAASFYYEDGAAGTPTITATLDDGSATVQTESVAAPTPPPPGGAAPAPAPGVVGSSPPAVAAAPAAPPPPPRRIVRVTKRFDRRHLVVVVHVVAGSARPAGLHVRLTVRRGSSVVARVERVTAAGGVATWRSVHALPRAVYVATATIH